jgi:uncharacterized protein YecE (DUF72 family)
MRLYAGTSGFSYKQWRGSFYPEDLPAAEMLRYYGKRLPAVEINNTFYHLPAEDVLVSWAGRCCSYSAAGTGSWPPSMTTPRHR